MSESPSSSEQVSTPFPQMEEEMAAYWKKHKIFERTLEERPAEKGYVFYDGPPFATGLPHYGHLLQSMIKDAIPRYWTMKGHRVPRRWGWDCHGLPIENLIEKNLGLGSKRDIESYGVGAFNEACRSSVFTYEKEWAKYVERLGRWVDFEHSYKTMDNDYIESVWWAFSELSRKGHVYKDVRVSLYCPRCSTPLSNFEIAMGNSYKDIEDPAIFLKFPVVGEEKTYFVAWTTTPWTVPAVTGLAVSADLMYVAAKLADSGETFIFSESRLEEVLKGASHEIVGRWKGTELVGKRFEPPYQFVPLEGDPYRVVTGSHVTADAGTGVVTTAPAFGEEDLVTAREHHLPVVITLNEEGRMIEACTPFAGKKAKEANQAVVEDLQARGFMWRVETITHSVPICWRCNTLLLYMAQPAWFVNVTQLKPALLKTAKKIQWHPAHFKEGRFGKGLETAPDWNISRTRYWGSPMPVWECVACKERTIIGSVKELQEKAVPGTCPEPIDLHRPMIDQVVIPCVCGGEQRRIVDVFDCWFESGSMPFAALHYPFENKRWFEHNFPADFIAEAQDQTRGWFYTLHVLASALFEKPAFTNVIVTGMVLAEDGKKMSKSLKNYPDPWTLLASYGADALRYYLCTSPVVEADSLNFSERDLRNVLRGVINLLWNVKTFYETYAQNEVRLSMPRSAHVLDRWLFARYAQLLKHVTTEMDQYELARATRPIRDFVDDLSTWWLRRSRDRLKSDNEFEREDALKTLREVLEETSKIIAPFMPFLAEKIYQDIRGQKASVHLERWPKEEARMIDERLLTEMAWVRQVVSRGHELRVAAKQPVRQTLASVKIALRKVEDIEYWSKQTELFRIVCEELNVERVLLERQESLEEDWVVTLDTVLTPELRAKGWRREFVRHIMSMRKEAGLQPQDRINVVHAPVEGDVKQALQAAKEELMREVKADTLEEVTQMPEHVLFQKDLKIADQTCAVSLVPASS